jgi:GntR family transcriptional regulator
MEIVLNRKAAVPLRDQLVAQLELRILGGEIGPGEKLPSVRTLARRLRLHHNTVSAAYQRLEAKGHVEMRPGAGVFVRKTLATSLESARDLDEMIRVALRTAHRRGYSDFEVRAAVERWLRMAPPARLVVVDPSKAMAELMLTELRPAVALPLEARGLEEVERAPELLSGALTVSLPYHVAALRSLAPTATVVGVNLEIEAPVREAIHALPAGALALVVSHAETVLPYARTLFHSLRGEELLVETRTLGDGRGWRRLLPAVDAVFVDELAKGVLARLRPSGLHPFRVLGEAARARVRKACAAVGKITPQPRTR